MNHIGSKFSAVAERLNLQEWIMQEEIAKLEKAGVRSMECRTVLKTQQHLFTSHNIVNCL